MKLYRLVPILLILIIWLSCGGDEKQPGYSNLVQYLPESIAKVNLEKTSEVKIYNAESLWEYIDGDAEIYLLYDFEEVAAVYYGNGEKELAVDLYRFKDPLHAYGLYSRLRPEEGETIDLGAEGFTSPGMLNVNKGEFILRIFGYDESLQTGLLMTNLAESIVDVLPGEETKPGAFALFPDSAKIKNTDDFYSELFVGQKFLTNVFSQDYALDRDTVVLFMAYDSTGEMYLQWMEYGKKVNAVSASPDDINFDEDYGNIIFDNYYGNILVGLKESRLIGMVNYAPRHKEFIINWLNELR